jgi:hypothetical protein
MKTYTIPQANMQALVAMLRPQMVADPKFRAECERCMQVRADHVTLYIDAPVSPLLHKAAIELGVDA